jgi:hypothetical protein
MPYLESGVRQRAGEQQQAYLKREKEQLRAAVSWLDSHAKLDRSRVYLAGVSKGGWHVGMLARENVGNVAGLVILIGGCGRESVRTPGSRFRGKSIYIGVGETDGGFVPSVRAREYYRRNGAFVTFEIYEGMGHRTPVRIPLLAAWFEAQARHAGTFVAQQNALRQEMGAEYKRILALADSSAQFKELRRFADDPRLPFCGSATYDAVHQRLGKVAGASAFKNEWLAEREFGRLIWKEANMRRLQDLEAVVMGMRRLSTGYAATLYGKAAKRCLDPLEAAYRQSMEATAGTRAAAAKDRPKSTTSGTITPAFPSVTRHGGKRPVRDGNKIIFKNR